jgi:hypothetical protein
MKKGLVILGIFILICGVFALPHLGEGQAVAAIDVEATAVEVMEAQILASTVQIELFGNGRIEGNQRHIQTSRGFGTIVQYEGRRFILTHNHWSIPAAELSRAEIRTAEGVLLLILEGPTFYNLARYRDGGTMLLDPPAELTEAEAAELGDSSAVQIGSTVWLATYDVDQGHSIKIDTAWVQKIDTNIVPGRLHLRGQETAVNSGDSGGGVWANGKLVANLWTIQVAEQTWGLGISLNRSTGSIVAGMQPLPGAAGVTLTNLTAETAVDGGFERGMQP